MYKEISLSELEKELQAAEISCETICQQHRMFANDSDTEEVIEARIQKVRSSVDKLRERVERRKRYAKETPEERLVRLKAEAEAKPHLFSPSLRFTVATAGKFPPLIPHSNLKSIDISSEGDLLIVANAVHVPIRGSLWCFRDILKNNIPARPENTTKSLPCVTEWKIDVPVPGFARGNNTAVGSNMDMVFTGAVHVQSKLVFFADSSAQIGFARYQFLDDIRTGPLRKSIPQLRIEMAEELCCGLFDTLMTSTHLPVSKPKGIVTVLSKFSDGRVIAGCEKGCFSVWDSLTCCRDQYLAKQMEEVSALQAMPSGSDIFVASDKKSTLKLFDLRKANPVASKADLNKSWVTALAMPFDSNILIAGTHNGEILVYDCRKLTKLMKKNYFKNSSPIRSIKFDSSNKNYAVVSEKEITIAQNCHTYFPGPYYSYQSNYSISSVAFHGKFCYATEIPGRITCHDYTKILEQNGVNGVNGINGVKQ